MPFRLNLSTTTFALVFCAASRLAFCARAGEFPTSGSDPVVELQPTAELQFNDPSNLPPAPWTEFDDWTQLPAPTTSRESPPETATPRKQSARSADSWQLLGGRYESSNVGPEIPAFDFAPVSIRYCRDAGNSRLDGIHRGYWIGMIDVTAATITSDYGTFLAGPSLLARRMYGERGRRVAPFIQFGTGIVFTDAYRDRTQSAIGQAVEFIQHAGGGARIQLNPRWSLEFEGELQHISNAGLASRNAGANMFGGMVGVTYFVP